MAHDPIQVLQGARRQAALPRKPVLLVAGATGVLGNEVVRRLSGSGRFASTQVLAREPMRTGLRGVEPTCVDSDAPAAWPVAGHVDVAVVMFDPPRLFYDRERALWTPRPEQLPALAQWLRTSGATTLAVVLPHAQGRLPEALKRGLASLDEQAVAALGFERLLIIRSAQKPREPGAAGFGDRVARFMLSGVKYMVPSSEQPVRAARVAQLVAAALEIAPHGIHIAAPELVWRAAQGELRAVAAEWLQR